jgi:N-acetylglucosamine-6-phosphate deacetylase
MQEDSIDTLLPWTDQYKDKLAKYHGKEPGSIQILKKEDEKHEEIIKDTVHTEPPYDKNTPCIDFNEGSLVLMWDKRKGKPRYDQKTTIHGLALTSSGRSLTKKGTI